MGQKASKKSRINSDTSDESYVKFNNIFSAFDSDLHSNGYFKIIALFWKLNMKRASFKDFNAILNKIINKQLTGCFENEIVIDYIAPINDFCELLSSDLSNIDTIAAIAQRLDKFAAFCNELALDEYYCLKIYQKIKAFLPKLCDGELDIWIEYCLDVIIVYLISIVGKFRVGYSDVNSIIASFNNNQSDTSPIVAMTTTDNCNTAVNAPKLSLSMQPKFSFSNCEMSGTAYCEDLLNELLTFSFLSDLHTCCNHDFGKHYLKAYMSANKFTNVFQFIRSNRGKLSKSSFDDFVFDDTNIDNFKIDNFNSFDCCYRCVGNNCESDGVDTENAENDECCDGDTPFNGSYFILDNYVTFGNAIALMAPTNAGNDSIDIVDTDADNDGSSDDVIAMPNQSNPHITSQNAEKVCMEILENESNNDKTDVAETTLLSEICEWFEFEHLHKIETYITQNI